MSELDRPGLLLLPKLYMTITFDQNTEDAQVIRPDRWEICGWPGRPLIDLQTETTEATPRGPRGAHLLPNPVGKDKRGRTRHSSMHKSPVDSGCESKAEESRVSVSVFEKQSWRSDQHWVGLMTESFKEEVSSV